MQRIICSGKGQMGGGTVMVGKRAYPEQGGEARPELTSFCRSPVFVLAKPEQGFQRCVWGVICFWKNQEVMISRLSHEQTQADPEDKVDGS